eukprot:scaffold103571_cov63-Phaeocystis_antarctica.AAC.2
MERAAKQQLEARPNARPRASKAWEAQLITPPTSSVASATAEGARSMPPRTPSRRTKANEKSGSSPRTVSAKDAASRPYDMLKKRKPSV